MGAPNALLKSRVADTVRKSDPGVQPVNTPSLKKLCGADVDWSDVRYLLEVGESGSLRKAARRRRVSVNTVRAHITRLEEQIGAPVLRRAASGTVLTDIGRRLFNSATAFGRVPLSGEDIGDQTLLFPNRLTLGCTEGLGATWLTPRIAELAEQLRPVTIDMQFDYDLQRDRSAVTDVGLAYRQPANLDLVVSKLATIHFMLFAAPAYLAQNGTPETVEELLNHRFVEQGGPGYNESAVELLLGADRHRSMTSVRTNSSITHAYAAANGAGIAILPSYVRAISTALAPLPIQLNLRVPLYCYYHADARDSIAVRTVIDWLRETFDQKRYPWFSDTFVHPDNFSSRQMKDAQLIDIFKHMIDRAKAR